MNIASEIEKLQKLHSDGVLSDAEFRIAKSNLLNTLSPENNVGTGANFLGKAAYNYVNFTIVSSVVGVILFVVIFLFFFLPHWNKLEADNVIFSKKIQHDMEEFDKDFEKRKSEFDNSFKKQDEEMNRLKN